MLTVGGLELYLTNVTAPAVSEFVTTSKITFGVGTPLVAFMIVVVFATVVTELFENEELDKDEIPYEKFP